MLSPKLPHLQGVTLGQRIGRGGMADVYVGDHTTLRRQVAVKLLHAHLLDDPDLQRRFRAEARAVAQLRHPHIVQVYDFDVANGQPYIVMEYIDGPAFDQVLLAHRRAQQRLPLETVVRLVGQVADGLDHAHAHGIVHRDIKPANILLRAGSGRAATPADKLRTAEAVVTDFGIARVAHASAATLSGALLGTPAYMAPEQVLGGAVDARTDIYSLGVVVYEALAGIKPFEPDGETPAAVLFRHVHEPLPALPREPDQLQEVVARAMAKDPADRYLTAGELWRDLRRAADGGRLPSVTNRRQRAGLDTLRLEAGHATSGGAQHRSRRWWAVAGLLVAILALSALGLRNLILGTADTPGLAQTETMEVTATGLAAATEPVQAAEPGPSLGPSPVVLATRTPAPTQRASAAPTQPATASATAAATNTPAPPPTSTPLLPILETILPPLLGG